MIPKIRNKKNRIIEICKKFRVTELYVFGSALLVDSHSEESDIDFAVIFDTAIPVEDMADHYFGLIEELERTLQNCIDLVTLVSIKNKIFKEELENTMVNLYAA